MPPTMSATPTTFDTSSNGSSWRQGGGGGQEGALPSGRGVGGSGKGGKAGRGGREGTLVSRAQRTAHPMAERMNPRVRSMKSMSIIEDGTPIAGMLLWSTSVASSSSPNVPPGSASASGCAPPARGSEGERGGKGRPKGAAHLLLEDEHAVGDAHAARDRRHLPRPSLLEASGQSWGGCRGGGRTARSLNLELSSAFLSARIW